MCQGDSILLSGPESMDIIWYPTSYFSDSSQAETYLYGSGTGSIHYIAQDTCGISLSDTFELSVNSSALSLGGDTLGVCSGDSLLLNAGSGDSYLWSTGSTQPSIYADQSGTYSVSITGSICDLYDSVFIEAGQKPAWTQDDTSVCSNNLVSINVSSFYSYDSLIWNDGETGTSRSIIVSSDSTLIVTAYEDLYSSTSLYEIPEESK